MLCEARAMARTLPRSVQRWEDISCRLSIRKEGTASGAHFFVEISWEGPWWSGCPHVCSWYASDGLHRALSWWGWCLCWVGTLSYIDGAIFFSFSGEGMKSVAHTGRREHQIEDIQIFIFSLKWNLYISFRNCDGGLVWQCFTRVFSSCPSLV